MAMNETQERTARAALTRALNAAGGQSQLAKMLGIRQPAVSQWKVAPRARVLSIEALTGVSRTELRPDVWGDA